MLHTIKARWVVSKHSRVLAMILCVLFFSSFLSQSFAPQVVSAACTKDATGNWKDGDKPCCPPDKLCNPIKSPNLTAFLMGIVDVVIQYGALLIVFFIVFAGFKFVTAQGNSEKISEARKMLTWIVVGAFVLLGVYVIRAAICGTIAQLGVDKACDDGTP